MIEGNKKGTAAFTPEDTPTSFVSRPVCTLHTGRLAELIRDAFGMLLNNPLRSALTISGIVIGVVAIVTLIAILQGVRAEIAKQVDGLGANLAMIVPGQLDENGQPNPAALLGVSPLTENDVAALRRVPGVMRVSPVYFVSGTVKGPNGVVASAFVVATNEAGVQMNRTPLVAGHYFSDDAGYVCILGAKPNASLFGKRSAVGQQVFIAGHRWKVVGVLGKPPGSDMPGGPVPGFDTLVYLPANLVRRVIPHVQVNRIVLQTDYRHPPDKLIHAIESTLLVNHHGVEDFGLITQRTGLKIVYKLINMAQALLGLIATISLFVAGIGIMNIMLVTVTERTREIGIRKTVGARRSDIFVQFLTEAVVLSLVGGWIGLVLSWGICDIVGHFSVLHPLISPTLVLLALFVCTLIGVLFGVAPAIRAARLDPIEALRHE
ncbi:ABC-type antimicrobial peptide transport system, permease component [Chthonomonas calidirosea]|uniref:ABC transporter permease n=1 Tax=Chthonomonas calidirosea TaxID=454171 RepID=UPI0006DD53EF|nr:ABC transporter permease [Chthonomonas calidirosea]CEK13688.1 ABC-type antimicrobial peptide transport system, permease component [Chthonomonas calidirosea]